MIVNSLIGILLVYSLLGIAVQAGAIYTFFTAVGEFFYHTNVRTPRAGSASSSSAPRCTASTTSP